MFIADVRRLNRLAEVLRSAERHFLARLDLDSFACGRVASHARGALTHLKSSEPGDADTCALLKVLADQVTSRTKIPRSVMAAKIRDGPFSRRISKPAAAFSAQHG